MVYFRLYSSNGNRKKITTTGRGREPLPHNQRKQNMEKKLTRKGGNTRGVITQKMVSFKLDNDNLEWLQMQPNKGRYINALIARDRLERSMN